MPNDQADNLNDRQAAGAAERGASAAEPRTVPAPAPLLTLDDINKSFFGVPVLKDVTLSLGAGQVLGLVGENGAGKSTLMNVLGGVLPPDAGMMTLGGEPYAPRSTRDAARRGVAFIHQELNLFGNLSIAENLHVPTFPRRRLGPLPLPLVSRRRMRDAAARLLREVELDRDPETPVDELSPGERQLVEIAKALKADARLVIFDEPTTSLTTREARRLFAIIERLRARGVSMVYISHRLEDVLRLCDEVAILRDGKVVGRGPTREFTLEKMISLMVGRTIDQLFAPRATKPSPEPVLEVKGVTQPGVVDDVSFTLHRGEVLGLSGLMGAGRTELARILFGLDPYQRGTLRLGGRPFVPSPRESVARGMYFLTENRREEGLMMDAGVDANMALVHLPRFATRGVGWVAAGRLNRAADDVAASVRLAGVAARRQPVRTLSGGNQQKVVIGKWLMGDPTVFILDEPTRGIDVGAKQEVYRIINHLAERGTAVLLISSELEELIGLCDRILVMGEGRIRDEVHSGAFDRERIIGAAFARGDALTGAAAAGGPAAGAGGSE